MAHVIHDKLLSGAKIIPVRKKLTWGMWFPIWTSWDDYQADQRRL